MNSQPSQVNFVESVVVCPFCRSSDTEMISLFGQQLMTTQHYCRNCHSAFEAVKWEEAKQEGTSDQRQP